MIEQERYGVGPLGPYAKGFAEHLDRLGFREVPAGGQGRLFGELSEWLGARELGPGELTDERMEEFLAARRRLGVRQHFTSRAVGPMVGYLRGLGVVPAPKRAAPMDPASALVEHYRGYLADQRGLVEKVVASYVGEAARFVALTAPGGAADVAALTTAAVSTFMAGASARRSRGSVANLVPALRSFLRFVHIEGITTVDLAVAVPSLAGRSERTVPKVLSPPEVARLIASCDLRRGIGRRDRAILVALVRLGLRAGEVAGLGLDDIDWRAGEVVVHGKGPRDEVLPLPTDVGEAIAGYLTRGRPHNETRAVFVRAVAPRVALSPAGVSWVVYAACDRAGLARVSAHCLRHSAASHMLAAGSSLAEVAQVLRHRRVATTAIYAKVDQATLAGLARTWPGATP